MPTLLDQLLAVPDHLDPTILPPRFIETRQSLQRAVAGIEADGVPCRTLGAALFSEALPRLIQELGPQQVCAILLGMARQIGSYDKTMQ